MMINCMKKIKALVVFIMLLPSLKIYSQDIQLVSKIVGKGDPANYCIGHFPVFGSDGLDVHWYGGIRFGDGVDNAIMNINNGGVGNRYFTAYFASFYVVLIMVSSYQ